MIHDPKVGDVVRLDQLRDGGWRESLGHDAWEITHVWTDTYVFTKLKHTKTGEQASLLCQGKNPQKGIWPDWLIRDEFLTACLRAVKEERNAAQTIGT